MKSYTAVTQEMLAFGILLALAIPATAQQTYPNRPIRLITPYPAGGSTTVLGRIIGQKMTEAWGQQVIIDNRPGGNTIIGTEALAKSPPDGYTILLTVNGHLIVPNLLPTPYDPINDFAPVATLASSEQMLVIHPSVPVNNLQQFIALAKSRPGELNYSSGGTGSTNHLAGELFNIMAAVKLQRIPYKGGAPAVTDLIGGQVQLSFQTPINVVQHIKNGRMKAIAISGEHRLSALPQVPTFSEAGLPGFDAKNWFCILAPGATPKGIINRLSTEIGRILASPDIKEKLNMQGMEPFISTPDQLASLMKAALAKYAKIITIAKIRMEK